MTTAPSTTRKRALITGITGQDGSYLAEFLLHKGYEVHGLIRRSSTFNTKRIDHIYQDPHDPKAQLFLHFGDLADVDWLLDILHTARPDEIYHLGAQSHVQVSFQMPDYTSIVTGLSTLRIIEAIRRTGMKPRLYQASSSEMFGATPPPQNEHAPFHPRSPYAIAKVFAYWTARNSREGYGVYASNGILFNHESPRRGETFVTRKITRAIAQIAAGRQQKLFLGNLDSRRDWGYAPEYVEAMWLILQQPKADDFVIGTGEAHSVREFVEAAFAYAGLDWRKHVEIDQRYMRPLDVQNLIADASKSKTVLGWEPKVRFNDLVAIMVDADLEALGLPCPGKGRSIITSRFPGWHRPDKGGAMGMMQERAGGRSPA